LLYRRFDTPFELTELTHLLTVIVESHLLSFGAEFFRDYEAFFVHLVQNNKHAVDSFLEIRIIENQADIQQLFYWDLLRIRLGYLNSSSDNESVVVALLDKLLCQPGYIKSLLQKSEESLKSRFLVSILQTYKHILQINKVVDQLNDKFDILKGNLEEVSQAIARLPDAVNLMKQIELLLIYRITGKMNLDRGQFEEYVSVLNDPNSPFDDKLLVLDLLVSNSDCLKMVLQNGLLINTLETCQPKNALESLKIIQLIQLICLNTKEEKLKELKQKYCVDDKDAKGFEKLNEMMKNSEAKFIDDSYLASVNFYDQLQNRCRFSRTLELYFEGKNVEAISGPNDLCRLLLKILMAKKFYAALFYKPKLIELLSMKIRHADHKVIEDKESIYLPLAARIVSGLEISQIAYKDLAFFVDALSEGVKQSELEMLLFESLFGLTRIVGEQTDLWKRVWTNNNVRLYILEHLWSENLLVQTAAFELFANCVCGGTDNFEAFERESEELKNSLLKRLASTPANMLDKIIVQESGQTRAYGSPFYLCKLAIELLSFLRTASETSKQIVDQEFDLSQLRRLVIQKVNDSIIKSELMELLN